ncbi:MAG TPA: membrane protein insertase YidC [Actinomycetes bacterium]|nr:membrane protein insertase YidC [Actinomycetes bacterium]
MGLLDPLYWIVAWVLVQFHAFWSLFFAETSGAAWALSIVGLVVVIRILLIPLFVKQIKAQRGLQILQPEIKAIQKRYKDDRQKQSEEMMKLYRETGTNPFASCLPILLQMPIFFALFHVLNYGVAQDHPVGPMTQELVDQAKEATIFGAPISATFLGSDELNVKIVSLVLIALMTLTTFITQKQLLVKGISNADTNPFLQQQKLLVYIFPLMFAVFGINFPIGVLIYWLTTNLWSMGQQYYVIRNNPAPGSPAYAEWEQRQARKAAKRAERQGVAPPTAVVEAEPEAETKPARQQPKRRSRSQRKGRTGGSSPSDKPKEES